MNKLKYKNNFVVEKQGYNNNNIHREISKENDLLEGELSQFFFKIKKI
jgi:hypothetical protein